MSNYNEDKMIDILSESFKKEAANTELPEALSKENIVKMLMAEQERTNPGQSTVSNKEKYGHNVKKVYIGKYLAYAAAFILVIGGATVLLKNRNNSIDKGTNVSNTQVVNQTEIKREDLENKILNDLNCASSGDTSPNKQDEVTTVTAVINGGVNGATDNITEKKVVKCVNDSSYTYRYVTTFGVSYGTIEIISVENPSEIVLSSSIELTNIGAVSVCDLYLRGNNLILVAKKADSSVITVCIDVSNHSAPSIVCTNEITGSLADVFVSDSYICTATVIGEYSQASVISNTNEITIPSQEEIIDAEPAIASEYTLLTVVPVSGDSDPITAVINAPAQTVGINGSSIFTALKDGGNTILLRLSITDSASIAATGNRTAFEGSVIGKINIGSGKARLIAGADDSYTAFSFDNSFAQSFLKITSVGLKDVVFLDNVAVAYGSSVKVIDFSAAPKFIDAEGTDAFVNAQAVFTSGNLAAAVTNDASGNLIISVIGSSGKATKYVLKSDAIKVDTSALPISDENGNLLGIPVIQDDRQGFIFIRRNTDGNISGGGAYTWSGTSSDVSVITGEMLYIMTGDRITGILISDILK